MKVYSICQFHYYFLCRDSLSTCADPEGGQGFLKNHKNIGFSSNTGPDPLKNRTY